MTDPHRHLIETICNEVLPNMVRVFESGKLANALDQDQFITIMEQKVMLAKRSLKELPVRDQALYREKIDRAYAENIDRLQKEMPALHPVCVQNASGDPGSR